MGELRRILDTGSLVPNEVGVKEKSVAGIVRAHLENPLKVVVPMRIHPYNSNLLVILDGHNNTYVSYVFNREKPGSFKLYGWIAESESDFIPKLGGGFRELGSMDNIYLAENFGLDVGGRLSLDFAGADRVDQMCAKPEYPFLHSLKALKEFASVIT